MNRLRLRRLSAPGRERRGIALAAIGVIMVALFLAGCSEDGEGPTIPEDGITLTAPESPDAPETTQAPATTQPPETTQAPATTQPPEATQPPEDESEGIPTEVWIVLGLVLLVVLLAGVLIGRGRSSSGGSDEGGGDEALGYEDVGGTE